MYGLRLSPWQMREREGFIIDAKDISKPLSTICLGSGTGLLVPHYDYDTSLVFLTAKVINSCDTWPLHVANTGLCAIGRERHSGTGG